LAKCKVFGNLNNEESQFLTKTIINYSDSNYPTTYVHDGHGDLQLQ